MAKAVVIAKELADNGSMEGFWIVVVNEQKTRSAACQSVECSENNGAPWIEGHQATACSACRDPCKDAATQAVNSPTPRLLACLSCYDL
jgi:hypothetical protein